MRLDFTLLGTISFDIINRIGHDRFISSQFYLCRTLIARFHWDSNPGFINPLGSSVYSIILGWLLLAESEKLIRILKMSYWEFIVSPANDCSVHGFVGEVLLLAQLGVYLFVVINNNCLQVVTQYYLVATDCSKQMCTLILLWSLAAIVKNMNVNMKPLK